MGVAARVAGAAARVPLLLDDGLRLLLLAQTQHGHDAVPEAAHDAAGAEEKQQGHAGQRADDDAGNGAAAQRAARRPAGSHALGGGRGGFNSRVRGGSAGDAVRGAELGGDGGAAGCDGRGDPSSSCSSSLTRCTVRHALSFLGAVLPARAADAAAGNLAGALGRDAFACGGRLGGQVRAVRLGVGCRLGPGGRVPGVSTTAPAGADGAAGDVVGCGTHLAGVAAVLVLVAAVGGATALHQVAEAVIMEIISGMGER